MGKTSKDEEYEAGVQSGKRGDFLEDLIEGNWPSQDSPYHKGYEYGAEHRYDSNVDIWGSSSSNNFIEDENESFESLGGDFDYSDSSDSYSTYPDSNYKKSKFGLGCLVLAGLFVGVIGLGIRGGIKPSTDQKFINKYKNLPLFDVNSTPINRIPALGTPAMRMPDNYVAYHFYTEKNHYNPKDWKVTPKTVSRTFDNGKTWQIIYEFPEDSKYSIQGIKAIPLLSKVERDTNPNERLLSIIISEP